MIRLLAILFLISTPAIAGDRPWLEKPGEVIHGTISPDQCFIVKRLNPETGKLEMEAHYPPHYEPLLRVFYERRKRQQLVLVTCKTKDA